MEIDLTNSEYEADETLSEAALKYAVSNGLDSKGMIAFCKGANWQQSLPTQDEWVKCSDRMPEEDKRVLVIDDDGDMFITMPSLDKLLDDTESVYTHWMELPNKPIK